MKILTKEQQDDILKKLVRIAIGADKLLKLAKDEEVYKVYEEIVNQTVDIAFEVDGIRGMKIVAEVEQRACEQASTEAVEVCPHCMGENIFPNYDLRRGYVVRCQHCGEEIMLCDECLQDCVACDWHETATGGECYRGTTTPRYKLN